MKSDQTGYGTTPYVDFVDGIWGRSLRPQRGREPKIQTDPNVPVGTIVFMGNVQNQMPRANAIITDLNDPEFGDPEKYFFEIRQHLEYLIGLEIGREPAFFSACDLAIKRQQPEFANLQMGEGADYRWRS